MENALDEIERATQEQKAILVQYIKMVDTLIQETNDNYSSHPEQINKVKDQSLHCGSIRGNPWYIKNGMFGYYLCIGKKDNISLKDFNGFNVENKINMGNGLDENETNLLIQYVDTRNTIRKQNMCIELSPNYSIRQSKHGYYVYYLSLIHI